MKNSILFLLLFTFTTSSDAQEITGILGAFPPELVLLQSKMENKKDTIIAHISFTKGTLNGRSVVLAQTGIGKVNAAITTTLMIQYFKPKEIVFSGIAGGIDPALFPGDIVIGTEVTYHDYGAIEDSGMIYLPTKNPWTMTENPVKYVSDPALVEKAISVSKGIKFSQVIRENGSFSPVVTKGIIVTGDVFVASETVSLSEVAPVCALTGELCGDTALSGQSLRLGTSRHPAVWGEPDYRHSCFPVRPYAGHAAHQRDHRGTGYAGWGKRGLRPAVYRRAAYTGRHRCVRLCGWLSTTCPRRHDDRCCRKID